MEKINSVFEKWTLIAATNERELNSGRWSAATMTAFHADIYKYQQRLDLDAIYQCVNSWYNTDLKLMLRQTKSYTELSNDIKILKGIPNRKFYFMTIGFDDKIITVPMIKESISKLKELKDIDLGEYVAEKFRKDEKGDIYIHHHIHCIVYTDKPKSKVIQYIYQKLKKVIASANFIDLKREQPIENYIRYILGDKRDEKLECIQLDIEWRELNNL